MTKPEERRRRLDELTNNPQAAWDTLVQNQPTFMTEIDQELIGLYLSLLIGVYTQNPEKVLMEDGKIDPGKEGTKLIIGIARAMYGLGQRSVTLFNGADGKADTGYVQ